ncbi:MAG: hypothetical protein KDK48_02365 [Chlamydiia bacterium]|nr:hypothetical protein [Chlamydiia bacterium]
MNTAATSGSSNGHIFKANEVAGRNVDKIGTTAVSLLFLATAPYLSVLFGAVGAGVGALGSRISDKLPPVVTNTAAKLNLVWSLCALKIAMLFMIVLLWAAEPNLTTYSFSLLGGVAAGSWVARKN